MQMRTKYNYSLYKQYEKCQANKEAETANSSFAFSNGESPLGNLPIKCSPCKEENAVNVLSHKEKRKKSWTRHYAQKHFQQTQHARIRQIILLWGRKCDALSNKIAQIQNSLLSKTKSRLKKVDNQLILTCFEEGKQYEKTMEKLNRMRICRSKIIDKMAKLRKEQKIFSHGAGLCGELPVPAFGSSTDENGKKVPYSTNCPGHVEIHSGYAENTNSHYVYLKHCGSTWFCLSCADKIFRHRRKEIEKAFDFYKGKSTSFITFTLPHGSEDYFPNLMKSMSKAMTYFKNGKAWQSFRKRYQVDGEIRTLEVTYSKKNGFHPHYHICFFYDVVLTDKQSAEVEKWIKDRWHKTCEKFGFLKNIKQKQGHKKHGTIVKTSIDPVRSEYLAKTEIWEMASTTSKTPKMTESISHWELQRLAVEEKETWAIDKWAEFMEAMKGKKAIWWSHKLKEKVGANNISDEELLVGEEATPVMVLSKDKMKVISAKQKNAELLEAVEEYLNGNEDKFYKLKEETGIKLEMLDTSEMIRPPDKEKGG